MSEQHSDVKVQESRVTYSTKELLAEIRQRLDRIDNALSYAPTRADIEQLDKRLEAVEGWRIMQEAVTSDRSLQFGVRERFLASAVALSLLALQVLSVFNLI